MFKLIFRPDLVGKNVLESNAGSFSFFYKSLKKKVPYVKNISFYLPVDGFLLC